MIKRSSGLFKIFFVTFSIVLAVFLALVTMTNLLDIVNVKKCLIGYILCSITIPFIAESIVYWSGKLTRSIYSESNDYEIYFEPIAENAPCFVNIENGIEKCVFFAGEGKILTGNKSDMNFIYDETENKIIIHNTQGLCKGVFKLIYGDAVTRVSYDIYTTVKPNNN